ncbi:deoxyribodipyrimidine photo-lyase [Variibacter gotjawalensis]|uniref:Deoxyribodipyrimidine photo-lyase n=1 Tax=Variibacter gotjawalensis TaxID=1333996 RepID=A0A0S3PSB3_9BRAD|nr:deoxyribodipyrimidine photo-lyase [Variibacter gotjawalensis]NIK49028.1 deoxyribodipyrimidine photo-lyase [Variibacter gotjawalensis]RZS50884.1 deoxyribodipyrimidine photo-lyase [Variibacter gotjawalensis]BAT58718.1 deoxyribodipyrimidine photo-lyase [Variibacter gotjawalensis]
MASTALLWFRDDLRLGDNAALRAAAGADALVCLYVLEEEGVRPLGGASQWWLANSLRALDAALREKGQKLILRSGNAAEIVPALADEIGASEVFWNRRYGPAEKIDGQVTRALKQRGIEAKTFAGALLHEPDAIKGSTGAAPKIFAPFWKRLRAAGDPPAPIRAPSKWPSTKRVASDDLADWSLEPTKPDWAGDMRDAWAPGEDGARKRLHAFVDGALSTYADSRERADRDGSSRLSPHLRFGEVSPTQVWHAAKHALDAPAKERPSPASVDKFLAELAWRDFAHHQLRAYPKIADENMRDQFDRFPWSEERKGFTAWTRGQTGYPLVDAAMRHLWAEGWMPNRLRMLTASFLIKHLLSDWRRGEKWFWDTLVDADPANNPTNWQWVAGSGIDSAPYFRIFNPVTQSEKADPDGDYVRKWVPEIAKLPAQFLTAPWEASPMELEEAGVRLGKTYPEPIVDHKEARERALGALKKMTGK